MRNESGGKLHAPTALPSAKEPQIPTGQEAGWAPHSVWMRWRRAKSLPCPWGEMNPGRPARNLVILSDLLRLFKGLRGKLIIYVRMVDPSVQIRSGDLLNKNELLTTTSRRSTTANGVLLSPNKQPQITRTLNLPIPVRPFLSYA